MARKNITKEEQLFAALLYADNPKDVLAKTDSDSIIALLQYLGVYSETFRDDLAARVRNPLGSVLRSELIDLAHDAVQALYIAAELESAASSHVDPIQRMNQRKNEQGEVEKLAIWNRWQDRVRSYGDSEESIRLPKKKTHWLPPYKLLQQIGKSVTNEHVSKISTFMQLLCADPKREFSIDEKTYKSYELFGFFRNHPNYTCYINPIAVPFLIEELGWCPKLPDDDVTRLTTSDMSERVFRTTKLKRINLIKEIANELLQDPNQLIAPDPKKPDDVKPVRDLVSYYNAKGRVSEKGILFFTEEMEGYIKHRIDLAPYRPDDRKHFLSENDILKNGAFFGYARMRPFHRQALRQLIEEVKDQSGMGNLIGFYRHEGAESYHVDPVLRNSHLTDEKIIERAQALRAKGWTRESGEPQPRPDDKKHWITASLVSRKLGFSTSKERRATEAVMQQQYEEGVDHIGYFVARGKGGVYSADPEVVGLAITREMVKAKLIQQPQRT